MQSATVDAWVYGPAGSPPALQRVERPAHEPGPGEVLVRMRAASLNYRDHVNLHGLAGRNVAGVVALSDGAGEVTQVGAGVTAWKPGDRVAGCFFRDWASGPFQMEYHSGALGGNFDGVLARSVVFAERGLVAAPPHLSWEAVASLPCAAVTAWQSLMRRGALKAGERVLLIGTGGVSMFGLQIAHTLGAETIVISSSDDKLARAKALGAAHGVNYRTHPNWADEVKRITGGRGVDHVLEVGGPGTLGQSLTCLAPGGRIALIGVLTGFGTPDVSLFPLMTKNASIDGIYVGSRDDFLALNQFLVDHQIAPVIDREFPFDEAPAAFEELASGRHFGKLVIHFD